MLFFTAAKVGIFFGIRKRKKEIFSVFFVRTSKRGVRTMERKMLGGVPENA